VCECILGNKYLVISITGMNDLKVKISTANLILSQNGCMCASGLRVTCIIGRKKQKVKGTLVQALRLCTGRTAHRGSRGIALLFHDQR